MPEKNENDNTNNNKNNVDNNKEAKNNVDNKDNTNNSDNKKNSNNKKNKDDKNKKTTKKEKSGGHSKRGTGTYTLTEEELRKRHEKNKQHIFCKYTKVARNVCHCLQLSQIVTLQRVCSGSRKMVGNLYRDKKSLDLSEFYGIIGSPEFDSRSFFKVFLPKWKNVESLSLRYCSHLQASHLDRVMCLLVLRMQKR